MNLKGAIKDIQFCKELMDRLLEDAKRLNQQDNKLYCDGHTVVQQDIIRVRRELNKARRKLDWDYEEGK